MDNTERKMRRLPRHVDGRLKILMIPIKRFFLSFLPIAIIITLLVFSFLSPFTFILGTIIIGLFAIGFAEFTNKECGFNILKDIIKYWRDGNKYFERSCSNVPIYKRFIRNQIKKQEGR